MSTLADLLAQKAELDKKIARTQRTERASAIARVRTLMAQYGLTLADIGKPAPAAGTGKPAGAAQPAKAAQAGKTPRGSSARKGKPLGKVAPKYRDPASGAAWSGRGLKPRWLAAALAEGRSLDEFRL